MHFSVRLAGRGPSRLLTSLAAVGTDIPVDPDDLLTMCPNTSRGATSSLLTAKTCTSSAGCYTEINTHEHKRLLFNHIAPRLQGNSTANTKKPRCRDMMSTGAKRNVRIVQPTVQNPKKFSFQVRKLSKPANHM